MELAVVLGEGLVSSHEPLTVKFNGIVKLQLNVLVPEVEQLRSRLVELLSDCLHVLVLKQIAVVVADVSLALLELLLRCFKLLIDVVPELSLKTTWDLDVLFARSLVLVFEIEGNLFEEVDFIIIRL